jgi:hypothetical protein
MSLGGTYEVNINYDFTFILFIELASAKVELARFHAYTIGLYDDLPDYEKERRINKGIVDAKQRLLRTLRNKCSDLDQLSDWTIKTWEANDLGDFR